MRKPGPLATAALAAIFAVAFGAAKAAAMSIGEALAAAYTNNPTLLGERAGLRRTDEQVPQALAGWRPNVEVSGGVGIEANRNTARATNRSQRRSPGSFGVAVSQSLFRGGRTSAAIGEAENTVRAGRARLIDTEQDVLLAAATAFLNVFRDEAVLSLNINNEKILERQLEAARDRFEVGEITRTDVHQAQARLAGATADRIEAEASLESSRANFENVVGLPAPRRLAVPSEPGGLPANRTEAVQLAATQNPEVMAAEFDRLAARDNVREVRGRLLPELTLRGSVVRSFQSQGEKGRSDVAELMVSLSMPIYQQGEVYSELREAKQAVAEEAQLIDRARRDAVEDATSNWENLVTARGRVKSFETQVEANIVALDGVEREAAVGSRTVLDILDAEQELLDSRVGLARAQRDTAVAAYEVLDAIGRMTARDLKLSVAFYDPLDHYLEVRDRWVGGGSSGQAD